MRYLTVILTALVIFGCGTSFFLNKEPMSQRVVIGQEGRSLELTAKSLIEDNIIRTQLVSEFYRGSAEIVYENGNFHMNYRNLPLDEEKTDLLKGDLYAAFFAGGYPYKSDEKMFGEVEIGNNVKVIKDTDGYTLYRVFYNGSEIQVHNLVHEYSIAIYSEKVF